MLLHIICLLWFAFLGCKKEPVPTPLPSKNPWEKELELTEVWKTYLDEVTKQETFSINPMLNVNGDILMSNFSTRSGREPIKLYDGKTGKLKWIWNDYLRDEIGFFNTGHTVVNNALILSGGKTTYALDMITGQTLWKSFPDTLFGNHPVFSDGEYIYKDFVGKKGVFAHHVLRTKYNQLNWELVCTYFDSTFRFDELFTTAMNFTTNSKGERLMIYALGCGGTSESIAILCCYNLNTKQFEWIKDHSDKYLGFYGSAPIYNGKLFLYAGSGSTWYLNAVNISDGSVAWQSTLPNGDGADLFLYKGNLISTAYVGGGNVNSPVICYDANSGSVVWQQNFTPEISEKLNWEKGYSNVFKNYLFSTHCSILLILNLDNGNVVCTKSVDKGCLQYGVAINEQARTFYVQDRTYVNCFKIPEEVKY